MFGLFTFPLIFITLSDLLKFSIPPHTHTYTYIYIYIYKQDLALKDLKGLISHKTQPTNQTIYEL